MNRPRRFDEDGQEDQGASGAQGSSHYSSGPPEHPGIGQTHQGQGAPVYADDRAHDRPHDRADDRAPPDGGYDPRHATWTTASAADPAADVYGPDSRSEIDPPDDVVDAQISAPTVAAKRRRGPILVFGAVFGVIVVAVGIAMFRVLAGSPGPVGQDMAMAPPPMPVIPPSTAPAPAAPVVQQQAAAPGAQSPAPAVQPGQDAAANATSSALAAPALPAVVPAVPGVTMPAAAGAAAVAAPTATAAAPTATAAQAKEVQALQKKVDDLQARLDTMSKDMAALRDQRSRQAAQSAPQKTAASEPKTAAKAERKSQAQTQTARRATPADRADQVATGAATPAVVTAPATAAAPSQEPMQGLNLRAVYPPSGADMQAWVMEGEVLRVVSRGSMIAGTRVVDVLPDRVVTERGVIR